MTNFAPFGSRYMETGSNSIPDGPTSSQCHCSGTHGQVDRKWKNFMISGIISTRGGNTPTWMRRTKRKAKSKI